jgi:hypothetical protein
MAAAGAAESAKQASAAESAKQASAAESAKQAGAAESAQQTSAANARGGPPAVNRGQINDPAIEATRLRGEPALKELESS